MAINEREINKINKGFEYMSNNEITIKKDNSGYNKLMNLIKEENSIISVNFFK